MTAADLSSLLLVKMSSLGDVVHAVPAACALRRRYPAMRLTWAIEEWLAPIVGGHPAVDRIVTWPRMRRPRSTRELASWARGVARSVRSLRSERYDVALDLQGLAKSAAIVLASSASRKLGIEGQREGAALVARAIPVRAAGGHVVDEYLRAAEFLGAAPAPPRFDLRVDRDARARIEARLNRAHESENRAFVVVGPSDSSWKRTPPLRVWVDVIRGLRALAPVILVGGAEQRTRHAQLAVETGCLDWTGETSIAELVALVDRAALHVGVDSGPSHLAAALGRPVVSLYGPTDPARVAPYGQRERVIRSVDMASIDSSEVIELCRRALVRARD